MGGLAQNEELCGLVKLLSNFYNFGMKPIYEKKFFNLLVINKFA